MKKLIQLAALAVTLSMSSAVFADMVNINGADVTTLKANLKGVGEKKAEAIVTYRTEHGGFKSLEEIKKVSGIGDGIYKKIEADISLSAGLGTDATKSAPTAAAAPAATAPAVAAAPAPAVATPAAVAATTAPAAAAPVVAAPAVAAAPVAAPAVTAPAVATKTSSKSGKS